jgi:hypothetical protein
MKSKVSVTEKRIKMYFSFYVPLTKVNWDFVLFYYIPEPS